jgi:predicted dienelactone hydrolase
LWASSVFGAQQENVSFAGHTGVVWLPDGMTETSQAYPLILFSHGWAGSATQSTYICAALADAGYIVIAPNHLDAIVGITPEQFAQDGYRQDWWNTALKSLDASAEFRDTVMPRFFDYENWTDATERGRADDIEAALDFALNQADWKKQVDAQKIGLMGHSLGGYTVLGLAGAWPSWKDARFRCVAALAPYSNPYVYKRTLVGVNIPIFIGVGTLDPGIFPYVTDKEGTYAQIPGPKYLLTLTNATHYTWTDAAREVYRKPITESLTAFFDRYLKGEAAETILDLPGSDLAQMQAQK